MHEITEDPGLASKVDSILEHVEMVRSDRVDESRRQLEIYNGDLAQYLSESIQLEITNPKSLRQTLARAIPVNTLKQVVNKLGKAYSGPVTRVASEEADQEFVEAYTKSLNLNSRMDYSTKIFNLHGYCGLEPYLDNKGKPRIRILDAVNFIPYSDDKVDPSRMTVAVKWIDRESKFDTSNDRDKNRKVDIYFLYSDNEFLIVDSEGDIRLDKMEKGGHGDGRHDLGIIPIIYVNSSSSFLVPYQDTEKKDIAINISKLLTDLNYASLYLSHSKSYGIDVKVPKLDAGADAMVIFESVTHATGTSNPTIGTLNPKINIEDTLKLISSILGLHLTSQGLTAGQMETGATTISQVATGISKMIDSADSTDTIATQQKIYRAAEENGLWKLLVALHNKWADANLLEDGFNKGVSDGLEVLVVFEKKVVIESQTVVTDRAIKIHEAGLISKKTALMMIMPDLDEKTIDDMMKDIEVIDEPTNNEPDNDIRKLDDKS